MPVYVASLVSSLQRLQRNIDTKWFEEGTTQEEKQLLRDKLDEITIELEGMYRAYSAKADAKEKEQAEVEARDQARFEATKREEGGDLN